MAKSRVKKVLLSEARIKRRINEMAGEISKDYAGRDLMVVCVLKGSIIFLADLVRRLKVNFTLDFIAVSSYRDAGTTGSIKLVMDLRDDPAGKNILLVEDIVDSGYTLSYLLNNLKDRCPLSIRTCVLLDKYEARKTPVQADYTGFRIKNEFVVGYGLDHNEAYRGLPYIGILTAKK
ncbi:MAG: hypoxanthine phosphoribosyltransferase [Elusimicrobiota bacterium]